LHGEKLKKECITTGDKKDQKQYFRIWPLSKQIISYLLSTVKQTMVCKQYLIIPCFNLLFMGFLLQFCQFSAEGETFRSEFTPYFITAILYHQAAASEWQRIIF